MNSERRCLHRHGCMYDVGDTQAVGAPRCVLQQMKRNWIESRVDEKEGLCVGSLVWCCHLRAVSRISLYVIRALLGESFRTAGDFERRARQIRGFRASKKERD